MEVGKVNTEFEIASVGYELAGFEVLQIEEESVNSTGLDRISRIP